MAYTDVDANFNAQEDRHLGFGIGPAGTVPIILTTLGGALFRAMYENPAGLTANSLGFTHGSTTAIPVGFRATRPPVIWQGEINFVSDNANIDPSDDNTLYEDLVVFDPAFNPVTPSDASPTLKTWAEALGGTYSEAGVA